MSIRLVETAPQGEGATTKEPLRHYLISVESGTEADLVLAEACHRALTQPGLMDLHHVTAPTLLTALVQFCQVFGVVASVYLHLYALLQHKKSA